MIRSMTGFGQAERLSGGLKLTVVIRSVNHRYGEITFRLPREWLQYEDKLRKLAAGRIKRGRTEVFITADLTPEAESPLEINWSAAEGFAKAAAELQRRFGFADALKLGDMLSLPDVIAGRPSLPTGAETEEMLADVFVEAAERLVMMRETEGQHLAADLRDRLEAIGGLHRQAVELAGQAAEQHESRLRSRIAELLGERVAELDETRLLTEVALLADKCDVHEELARLDSHMRQFADMLSEREPVGRKLDFIAQEMNREVNTIGSKTSHAALIGVVVELKAELEKVREQAQNAE